MKILSSLFILSVLTISLHATNDNGIKEIDRKIEKLKKEQDIQQLQGSNEEVEGQRFMIGDWDKYSKEIEDVKMHQKKAQELQKEIDALEKQKAELSAKRT